jgi:hypothetical protein
MKAYTVVWSPSAANRLAELWLENPAIRGEIRSVVDAIEKDLTHEPLQLGEPQHTEPPTRLIVRPPVSLVYAVAEDDRLVQVTRVKFWDD